MKKLLSVVLALLMLAVMLPVTAMAEDTNYCTIDGITEADGTTLKHFGTLTDAAKAWRESKGVVTEGNTFGANNLGTVEFIVWNIYGTVPVGDGAGVVGDNGAGECIFTGGYFTPDVTVSKVTVTGHNNATISKTNNDKYRVSVNADEVVFANITFEDTMRNTGNPGSLTFTNCTFKAGLRMPHAGANSTLKVENCTFTGEESDGYAIFVQGTMTNVVLSGNQISNAKRGINVQADSTATVSITGNTITNLTGKTGNGGTYGSAIQLTSGQTFNVTGNTIDTGIVNAFHFYTGLDANVTINNNKIKAPYLLWNEANLPQGNITSSGNVLDIDNPGQAKTKTAVIPTETVINGTTAPGTITIIVPSTEETKPAEDQKNPSTGANDMVAAAAALMAVSALGMAVLSRKK